MSEEKKEEKKITDQLCEKVEEQLKKVVEQGIQTGNIDFVYKLVDIHKDLANEKYWKIKEENYMNYRGYGEGYNEGYGRRYRGEYGRRGVKGTGRGRYRGDDAMMEMQEHYEAYNEAFEEAMGGDYGAEGGMVKSAEGIMKSVFKIVEELAEADSPEVMQVIKKYSKKITEMQ